MLKTLTLCYTFLLATIVLLTNFGFLQQFSSWLHHLPFGDKTCHFLFVGGLSFLVSATLGWHNPRHRFRMAAITIVALSAFTSLEEMSQSMLVHRRYDPADLMCNVAGTWCFGLGSLLIPMRLLKGKSKPVE